MEQGKDCRQECLFVWGCLGPSGAMSTGGDQLQREEEVKFSGVPYVNCFIGNSYLKKKSAPVFAVLMHVGCGIRLAGWCCLPPCW